MRHPLTAEILALSPVERLRLAAHLLDARDCPEIVLLLLDGVIVDVMKQSIQREATWKEPTH
jgi:hypothetical protein